MNYSIVLYIVGYVLKFEGIFLLLPTIVSIIYQEHNFYCYLIVAAISFCIGSLLCHFKKTKMQLFPRDGFASVALSWIVLSIFGAIPFVLTGDIPSYTDALFETISGFTTTGASIIPDVEALTHSGLFWRSFTHWVGGMGVLVFIMAILPLTGSSTMNLMKAESPGPSVDKLVPHVKDTAKILYGIYIGITAIELVLLILFKMPVFDAFTLTFGTVGTGGFGVLGDSIASYSPTLQIIITIFMILSGVNYTAYFLILTKRIKSAIKMEEVRWYFIIILTSVAVITLNTMHMFHSIGETLRHASFQVGSIITTTGYATYDFDTWPTLSKTILVMLMFVGACAGSTGGGMKVSRFVILFRTIKKELSLLIHPREVRKVRMDDHAVSHEVIRSTNVYVAVYLFVFFTSLLLISIDNFNFTTNFTAIAATLNNIGPGLDLVGPTQNFSIYSGFSKYVMMFDMLAGRLELFPMLILFHPSCWRRR